jgi:CelD/BcsL family acetyltransferase involved in cellulose biosynthesis
VLPWLEHYQREPRALFLTRGDKVALALFTAERLGPAGPSLLRPPGLGVSDYLDLLLPADQLRAAAAVETLLDWLIAAGGWELLDLPNLPSESSTAMLLTAAAARRGLVVLQIGTNQRPYVELPASWSTYLASRPSKLRYNLRARQRQLAALGQLRLVHYTSPEQVAANLPRAVALHARRWQSQHISTTFSSSPLAQRFYLDACQRLADRGWLDLAALELDDRLVAFALTFKREGRLFYYLPAFDPDYARYAPSTMLLAHLIETACAEGLGEVDFMLGDEPYKAQWASGSRSTSRLVIGAPTVAGRLALAGFRGYLVGRERARRSSAVQQVRRYGWRGVRRIVRDWIRESRLPRWVASWSGCNTRK